MEFSNALSTLGAPAVLLEGVVVQWCIPVTLQLEQSGGQGSIPGRLPPLDCHDKGLWTPMTISDFCDPSNGR